MPELPEVETSLRGIRPFLLHQTIAGMTIRQTRLRIPVTPDIARLCAGQKILAISRRAKYFIVELSKGFFLIHLGMSGHLRIVNAQLLPAIHDHIDLHLTNNVILRYHDPRRFGLWLYLNENPIQHQLLKHLGPEPLLQDFNGEYLVRTLRQKKQCIKSVIMDNRIVVGIGNIYATESLFAAGIHPRTAAAAVSAEQCMHLSFHVKQILQQAIEAGGTTLRDYYTSEGKPGYFSIALKAYGRQNTPCIRCQTLLATERIAGRSSAFCPRCQPYCPLI